MLDDVDAQLLAALQFDARVSNVELARQVGMAPSAVLERVRKLEERGLIRAYEAKLNARALGIGLTAFVFVRAEERIGAQETSLQLAEIPEVQEVHHIAGEDCYLVKLRVHDTDALAILLRESFGSIPTIRSTRTTIVLQTVKEVSTLPIPAPKAGAGKGEKSRV
ncbi:Lrp/AsnC family transcriptional regulator [Paludibaculum fermentans]|uniref:Lrp/AsnC family transcriptional regulator n=1 Tax=Paludibaculum fermentans TaxID=1473598 RepID=UPI003EB77531